MCRLIVCFMIALYASCFGADDHWITQADNRSDPEVIAWLKKHLKAHPIVRHLQISVDQAHATSSVKGKCNYFSTDEEQLTQSPKILAFMSLSLSDQVWISLSKELEMVGGAFLLRGLPGQSFRELANRVMMLKEKGVNSPIQIDPRTFQLYQVDHVPAFVVVEDGCFDKVSGNISLKCALDLMVKKGDTKIVKELYQIIEGKS